MMPRRNRVGISDVCQKDFPYFNRLTLVAGQDGKFYLIAFKQHQIDNLDREQIRFKLTETRLLKLAKEICEYFNRQIKLKEWTPSFDDWQVKMEERYSKGHALYMWFIDHVRDVVNMKQAHKEEYGEVVRIYEWLKGNEKWLYEGSS